MRFLGPSPHSIGVATFPDGLNKPFDRIIKDFSDEAPRLFMHVTGMAAMSAVVELIPLRRESAPPVVQPDYVAELSIDGGRPFTFHVEFYLDWAGDLPRTMARYGGSLAWQYQRQVVSILMLLRRDRAPADIPSVGEYVIGETRTTHPYKVVRAWEIDPAPVLQTGNPRMLPWAMLMAATDQDVRRIAEQLRRHGDEESIARFLTLGSLRYDRNTLEAMLEGSHMGLAEAIIEGSSLVREAKEKAAAQGRVEGLAAGLAKGHTEGRTEEARKLLIACVEARFPGLEKMPQIQALSGIEVIESLLPRIVTAPTLEEARREVLAAAGNR